MTLIFPGSRATDGLVSICSGLATRHTPAVLINSFIQNYSFSCIEGLLGHPCQWLGHLKRRLRDTDGFHLPHTVMSPPLCETTASLLTTRKRFRTYLFYG